MPGMTDAEFEAAALGRQAVPLAGAQPVQQQAPAFPSSLTPETDKALAATAAMVPQPSSAEFTNPTLSALREKRLEKLGKTPGVPFNEEGLDTWTTLLARSKENTDEQLQFLARRFGSENVRLNKFNEPVVRIVNPDTNEPEDYPLNPRDLTLGSIASLARFAPDVVGAMLAVSLGDKSKAIPMLTGRGVVARSIRGAIGGELGAATRELAVDAEIPSVEETKSTLVRAMSRVPADVLFDLGLAGGIKAGQIGLGVLRGKGIPNPLAGNPLTKPADPGFTQAGLEASQRNKARSGIDPKLRPSEASGIPLMAMMEKFLERRPAGTTPMVAGMIEREQASKAFQQWLVDPSTLPTDEEIGRKGLSALRKTLEPVEQEVKTAQQALQTTLLDEDRKRILSQFRLTDIPDKGVPFSEAGDLLREKYLQARTQFRTESSKRYDAFFDHPKSKAPIVSGDTLKQSIDELRKDLPKVVKTVEEPTGLVDEAGQAITREREKVVPFSTPVRGRLDELSSKLKDGKVSINDLKQIRTDLDDAIKIGEAVPGVKEGRLKAAYAAVSDAITKGLEEIKDPELSRLWKDATGYYKQNVGRFTEKNVARLAKEAEQTSYVGGGDFAKKAIGNEDTYKALRQFYGLKSPEIDTLRRTTRAKVLHDALGVGDMVDGENLVRALKHLRGTNPELYKDAFAGKGNDLLRSAEQMMSFKNKLPLDEIEKLLDPAVTKRPTPIALTYLQAAQKKLAKEYQNQVINRFLRGDIPAADLSPEKFVSFLPEAKLSDVREVMARIQAQSPEVAEQIRRKSVLNLLSEARRVPQPRDTMAKLQGEAGDLISGIGVSNALGRGDQLEKYKVLLGDLFEPLADYAKTELLGEERERIARGVGMLAPGSAMNMFIKALTPWEGGENKAKGVFKEVAGLVRDKVLATVLSSDKLRSWLTSPYATSDASNAIKIAIMSQPFIEGLMEEINDADLFMRTMAQLKVAFDIPEKAATAGGQGGPMTDEEFQRAAGR